MISSQDLRDETFKKGLFSFMADTSSAVKKGRKKKSRKIKVQSTSKSRRLFKARGSLNSRKGRPRNDILPQKDQVNLLHRTNPNKKR